MTSLISYKNRAAKTYAEAYLFTLAASKAESVPKKDLRKAVEDTGLIEDQRQHRDAVRNFKNLGIIYNQTDDAYIIDRQKLRAFAADYVLGNVRIWYSDKGQEKRAPTMAEEKTDPRPDNPRAKQATKAPTVAKDQGADLPSQNPAPATATDQSAGQATASAAALVGSPQTDIVRAVLVAHMGKTWLTVNEILDHTLHSKGKPVAISTISFYLSRNRPGEVEAHQSRGPHGAMKYRATENLLQKHKAKKSLFCALFPPQAEDIRARFAETKNGSTDAQKEEKKRRNPSIHAPSQGSWSDIIRAIFAAYSKALSAQDMHAIAKKHGHVLPLHSIYYYQTNYGEEIIRDDSKGENGRRLFRATAKLFKDNFKSIALYKTLLPDRAEKISARFARCCPDERRPAMTGPPAPQEQAPNDGIIQPTVGDAKDYSREDMEPESVDVANVGAAIVAYIQKLKAKIHDLQKGIGLENPAVNYKEKMQNMAASMTGIRAERDGLQARVNKLEAIVEEKDRRLNKAIDELAALKEKADKGMLIPSTFKVGEVARITKLIKGGRRE